LRRDIPPALDAIVARAMSKRLETRYASWQEFAHDLAQAFRDAANRECAVDQFADLEKFDSLRGVLFLCGLF
jgi:hypothetical protein